MNSENFEENLKKMQVYCDVRERCVQDVRNKLTKLKIPDNEHFKYIKRLQSSQLLNEDRFCRAFIHDKTLINKWGVNKIIFELQKRDISDKQIQSNIHYLNKEDNELVLRKLLRAKKQVTAGGNTYEIRNKLYRYALSRGFLPDEINLCLNQIMGPQQRYSQMGF